MYSQNDEEQHIVNYFSGHVGRFLDIGGYNPIHLSNTRRLYELGWSGIYVEPSIMCFDSFVKEYHNNPRIVLINKAVVSSDIDSIILYESNGDAVSSTSPHHVEKWQKSGVVYTPIKVEAISTQKIESEYTDIDFLSIDVESTNQEILASFTDEYLSKIKMICIEHDSGILDLVSTLETQIKYWEDCYIQPALSMYYRLKQLGFSIISINGENVIFVK